MRPVLGVAFAVVITLLLAACSGSDPETIPEADDRDSIVIAADSDDVVLQLGGYDIGENIDEFVTGPDLVIYGDGSVYRDTLRIGDDGPMRFQQGEIVRDRLGDIVTASRDLPESVGDECGEDDGETSLVVEGRSWSTCGLLDAPDFERFVQTVLDQLDSIDMVEWNPPALVEHVPLGGPCAVVESSTLPAYQTAAVYPHVTDRFPLGEFDCPRG